MSGSFLRSTGLLAPLAFVALACGSSVVDTDQGGTTSGASSGSAGTGASSSSSAAASSSSSGAGGSSTTTAASSSSSGATTTSSSSGASSTSSASSTSTSGGACTGTMTFAVGNGGPQTVTSDCATDTWNPTSSTTSLGWITAGGPPPGFSNLNVDACQSTSANALGVTLLVNTVQGTGVFNDGSATYTDTQGKTWMSTGSYTVTITKLGGVGDTIEGSFVINVIHPPSQIAQEITGSFSVCHIADQDEP